VSGNFKSLLAAVNEVLYTDWAPIGFVDALPRDEYESEALRIISMLAAGGNEPDIAQYLSTTGSAMAGYSMPLSSVMPVAQKLVSFSAAAQALKTSNYSIKRDALKRAPYVKR
jgi:hypothetical protein